MTQRLKGFIKYSLSAAMTALFLYLAFRGTDFPQLYDLMSGADYWWMLFMFACLMMSTWFRAWRWRYLLEPIKPRVGMYNLFSGVMIGYVMNNILPRAGEVMRPYSLGKVESLPMSSVFGTVVVERILDMVSFVILLFILPVIYNGPLRESFPWLYQTGIITSTVVLVLLAVSSVLLFRRDLTDHLLGKIQRLLPARGAETVRRLLHSFLDGFLFVKRPRNFLPLLILSILIWFLYAVMMYVAFYAFNLQEAVGFRAAVVVLTISTIGVALPTPGSTGTYHFFVSAALTKLFLIPDDVALSYATLTHAFVFIGTTVVGLYFFLRSHVRFPRTIVQPVEQPQ